ncbi:hypothetical protein GCM10023189_58240 [Nibrella saemangeumensis]|uniref:Signal transduction histidine kinase internal region domain-containing protein n=1 Tax=Nibrella saemangeumensis TaxID=1084526 RepID=A0ABP8NS41_9BACT
MKHRFGRFIGIALVALLLAYFLLTVDTAVPTAIKLQLIGLVIATGFAIYLLLAWVVPYLINRTAEQLSPQRFVAVTLTSSGIVAAITGFILLNMIGVMWQVPFAAEDYFFTCGMFAVITSAITAVYSLKSFVERWKGLLLMEEGLKQAVLKAEFESLKNQINPHFLFNSLNILTALIPEDSRKAVQFVERLSKMFRYNLQHSDQNTVELATELRIAESYLFIQHMRFGDNFRYAIQLADEDKQKQIVTQGLLTLLENVVKHNECSQENPLTVGITSDGQHLIVGNSLQLKSRLNTVSTGIGLRNLQSRYAQLAGRQVEIQQTEKDFIVRLPLL